MNPTESTKIVFAAKFQAQKFDIFLLQRNYNSDSKLLIKVNASSPYYWESHKKPYLAFWGPINKENGIEQINRLIDIIKNLDKNNQVYKVLEEILNSYQLNSLNSDYRSNSKKDFFSIINSAKLINFVDGTISPDSESKLTLSSAQNLSDKLRSLKILNSNDLKLIKTLLTKAPLIFGYWGPFKTVMKYFDPKFLPKEFGIALGRLSLQKGFTTEGIMDQKNFSSNYNLENINWLSEIIPSPSVLTIDYMLRRMRRELIKIGVKDLKTYSIISANALINWDKEIDSKSFIPAYIMGGKVSLLDNKSRYVKVPLLQNQSNYPFPDAWKNNLDLVREIFNSVTNSSEIFTFCCQILLDEKENIPTLNKKNIILALKSKDLKIINLASNYIADYPDLFVSLTDSMWLNFFSSANIDSIKKVIKELISRPILTESYVGIINGIRKLLEIYEKKDWIQYLNNIESSDFEESNNRNRFLNLSFIGPASLLYLKYNFSKPRLAILETSIINSLVIESIADFYDLEKLNEEYLFAITKINIFDNLKAYLNSLQKENTILNNFKILSDIIIEQGKLIPFDDQKIKLAFECFRYKNDDALNFGWLLIGEISNWEDVEYLLWDELRKNISISSKGQKESLKLIHQFLNRASNLNSYFLELFTDNSWNFVMNYKIFFEEGEVDFRNLVWKALGQDNNQNIAQYIFNETNFINQIGEILTEANLEKTNSVQQQMLLKYINNKQERIKKDHKFTIALLKIPNRDLQECTLRLIKNENLIEKYWITIAEIGLPIPLETIRQFINSIPLKRKFSEYVLTCIDSIVSDVRDMGLEFLDKNPEKIDDEFLWPLLTESDDPKVQARVAERTLINDWNDSNEYDAFDRRLLISRRINRKAKELVKSRITQDKKLEQGQILSPCRKKALIELSKGTNSQDKAWALRNIAILMQNGISFDGIQIKNETGVKNK